MTILTNLPVTLVCGVPVVVTLDKAQLITDFGIVDPFWSDSDNWVNCRFIYESDASDQKSKLVFAGNTYSLNFNVNSYNGNWLCSKVLLWDGNNNQYVIKRADFPVANEFDFASIGGYPQVPPEVELTYEHFIGSNPNPLVNPTSFDLPNPNDIAIDSTSVGSLIGGVANYDVTWEISNAGANLGGNCAVGFSPLSNSAGIAGIYLEISNVFQFIVAGGNAGVFGAGIPLGGSAKVRMVQEGTDVVKFYINDVLAATIAGQTAGTTCANLYPTVKNNFGKSIRLDTSYKPNISSFSSTWINGSEISLSNADYTITSQISQPIGQYNVTYADTQIPLNFGKYYKEITLDVVGNTGARFAGISLRNNDPSIFDIPAGTILANPENQYQVVYDNSSGNLWKQIGTGGTPVIFSGLPAIVAGDKLCIAIDLDSPTKDLYMGINGVWFNGADPVTGVGKIELTTIFPGLSLANQLFFQVQSVQAQVWTFPQAPLYTPVGYTNV